MTPAAGTVLDGGSVVLEDPATQNSPTIADADLHLLARGIK